MNVSCPLLGPHIRCSQLAAHHGRLAHVDASLNSGKGPRSERGARREKDASKFPSGRPIRVRDVVTEGIKR